MRDYFGKNNPIRFVFPIDGDCVNKNDGVEIEGGIRITVSVAAPEGHEVTVCGSPATYTDGVYKAEVNIYGRENFLRARDLTDGTECEIKVFKLPDICMGGYRLSSDDNVIFLQDITEHKDVYKSIFENPYLAVYKKAHDLYGAKVHLNLFYEFDEVSRKHFSPDRTYFNLSMMTDKFKDEFIANSDWLKFSFHAKSEKPDCPYKYADAETISRDCIMTLREIERFAGKETISETTTVHWGEATKDGVRALRTMGYKAMTGYFIPGKYPVAYYAPDELIEYIFNRDFWYDTETDVLFGRIDRVVNTSTNERNLEYLKDVIASPTRGGFVSIMIHEQYFYEDYKGHLADFEARVLDACKLLSENGYVGRHVSEMLAERPLCCFPYDKAEPIRL